MAKVAFYKNWVVWTSLVAAVPALLFLIFIVQGAMEYGPQFGWPMATVVGITGLIALFLTALPILLALGKFIPEIDESAPAPQADGEDAGEDAGEDGFDDEELAGGDDDGFDDFDDDDDPEDAFDAESGEFEFDDD